MANFPVHQGASLCVGVGGFIAACSASIPPEDALLVGLAGYAGGLLPDIDSEVSIPNKQAKVAGYVLAVFTAWQAQHHFHRIELPVLVALALAANYLFWVFADWVFEHRNHTHSIYGAVCFTLFITALVAHVTTEKEVLYGAFLACFASYQVHLALDDIVSYKRALLKGKRRPKKVFVLFNRGSELEFLLVSGFGAVGIYGVFLK